MSEQPKKFIPGKIVEPALQASDRELDQSNDSFAVHCSQVLLSRLVGHAVKFKQTEVFGILLGNVFKTPSDKLRTIIEDFIPAERFQRSTVSFVEVSAEELIRIDHLYENSPHKNLLKVGWFHTHPGHGIFMSHTDRENHRLYCKPWQVALVIDPVRETYGFFHGSECAQLTPVILPEQIPTAPGGRGSKEGCKEESPPQQEENLSRFVDEVFLGAMARMAQIQIWLADRTLRIFLKAIKRRGSAYENAHYQEICSRISALMTEISVQRTELHD